MYDAGSFSFSTSVCESGAVMLMTGARGLTLLELADLLLGVGAVSYLLQLAATSSASKARAFTGGRLCHFTPCSLKVTVVLSGLTSQDSARFGKTSENVEDSPMPGLFRTSDS